jgi:hypothetical protein
LRSFESCATSSPLKPQIVCDSRRRTRVVMRQEGGQECPPHTDRLLFVLAHLLGQIALVAKFLNEMHLGFEEVDVTFLILEELHEQIS